VIFKLLALEIFETSFLKFFKIKFQEQASRNAFWGELFSRRTSSLSSSFVIKKGVQR